MTGLLDTTQMAVLHDAAGELAAPPTAAEVRVYMRGKGEWAEAARHALTLPGDAGLEELRSQARLLATRLGSCRIVVGAEDPGSLYGILDQQGFAVCLLDRFDPRALEGIRHGLLANLRPAPATPPRPAASRPHAMAPGRFFLDMAAAKETDPLFTAREAILVFIERTPFTHLQIKCEHAPRWLESFALVTGLVLETEALESGLKLLTLRQPAGRDEAALVGQKWYDAGGCSCGG
ncbi:Fe-only nitrogenase accessory AnfO family protein [Desulfovibrio legallii]|uniref:Iron only nitrogenase protein AnfO (AnfO_nitrog) n=1 Tax=Desulfovibrio legallii TaxID=571438 RepID=A0A1G7I6U4_9BACT|nr:Fe-only nitrogenase accessory AnfO family protein [Desulfovibrio legallii]SDF08276.1 Iron only nitrogenase protein AnfO (AnfO_nitrog) [Desulfovibrio legallii]